ncbi:MAG: ATP-binding protein [Planctomycetes bacterium]|nr:ATP-binding protein [Planctomycetota bacterium]
MATRPAAGRSVVLGWAFTFIVAGALAAGALVAYSQVEQGLEAQLERRLKSYAAGAAGGLDPEALAALPGAEDAVTVLYRNRLRALQGPSGVRRAAVLRRDGSLVLDTEGAFGGGRDFGFGNDANELEACFARGPLATITYTDDQGRLYRNGFAPVRREDGAASDFAVAVELEADYADRLSAVRNALLATVLGVLVVTLGAAALLAGAWNRLHKDLERQTRLAELAQFSAGMAHQIKNPLAALRGYVELLARSLHEPMQRQIADKLIAEIGALDRVVRDFLQFSRGAHGSVEKLDLESALRPVGEAARASGGGKVAVELKLPRLEVEVDSTALREALSNLAVNAAEAMAENGGTLTIRAALKGKEVSVEVEDSGPGIPPEVGGRLFEPFVTGKADGTGLGLAIARRLLRDLGGDLVLVRTGPGGTMFRATFLREDES